MLRLERAQAGVGMALSGALVLAYCLNQVWQQLPFVDRLAQLRQDYILQRMLDLNYITEDVHAQAMAEELVINRHRNTSVRAAAHMAEEACQLLLLAVCPEHAYAMGLDVATTIRMGSQLAADKQLRAALVRSVGKDQVPAVLRDGSAIRVGAVSPRIVSHWSKLPGGKRRLGADAVTRVRHESAVGGDDKGLWLGYDQPRTLGNATGGVLALPIWSNYMSVALDDRQEQARIEPPGLAPYGDDYVYAEYVEGTCLQDGNDFIFSGLKCRFDAAAEQAAREQAQQQLRAQERDRILDLFSPGG